MLSDNRQQAFQFRGRQAADNRPLCSVSIACPLLAKNGQPSARWTSAGSFGEFFVSSRQAEIDLNHAVQSTVYALHTLT